MENVDIPKKTSTMFFFNELFVFISQTFIFFFVAIFTSDFLKSEERLVAFLELKVNDGSMRELLFTFFAIAVVIGVLSFIEKVSDNNTVSNLINEILQEIPKTIYFFGSSITGVMLAVSLFLANNANDNVKGHLAISLSFALMAFIYGSGLSYLTKKKTHIFKKTTEQPKA